MKTSERLTLTIKGLTHRAVLHLFSFVPRREYSSTKAASWRCSSPILKRVTTWPWRSWVARSHARWSAAPSILIWRSSTIYPCRGGDHPSLLVATVPRTQLFNEFLFRRLLIFNHNEFSHQFVKMCTKQLKWIDMHTRMNWMSLFD